MLSGRNTLARGVIADIRGYSDRGMTERHLVSVFASRQDAALSRILAESGWRVEPLDILRAPAATSDSVKCSIGIVQLASAGDEWLGRLLTSIEHLKHITWIAVLDRSLLSNDRLREFISANCVDYQTTPLERERILFALGHAAGMAELSAQWRTDSTHASSQSALIGAADVMQRLRRDVLKVATANASVLITGESGTGKELVAHAIHVHSLRSSKPFIAVNCVSLSPSLIHAELFGFERGAFTGAHRQKRGQFELADGGTILLDEIGDLHLELQSLLLRFLEEHLVRRVGGQEQIPVDVRVLAATNVDLESAVRTGRFREDLYYRLNVLRILTPALRDHRDDIEALAHELLHRFVSRKGGRAIGFTKSALTALHAHHWPGNVRELVNRVHRASVMCDGRMVTPADLQLSTGDHALDLSLDAAIARVERQTVLAALQMTGWNASQAAAAIGVSRATLYRLIEKHALALPAADSAGAVGSTP